MRKRVDQDHRKRTFSLAHVIEVLQESSNAACKFRVTIDKGIALLKVVVYLLQESLHSGKHAAERSVS